MTASIQKNLQNSAQKLNAIAEQPFFEAEILLAFTLNVPRSFLHTWPERLLTEKEQAQFSLLIERRLQHEPIAYLTGQREFWSLELVVDQHTLIPRPETELLVETAFKLFPDVSNIKAADLGTGSGAIALALASEKPDWQLFAVDISEKALAIAANNAQRLGFKNISFLQGSWCTALPEVLFDLIISNPPYIAMTEWQTYKDGLMFEPELALVSGEDGLDAIREIAHTAKNYLRVGGYLLLEHGFQQGESVRQILLAEHYHSVQSLRDLSGHERVTLARI